LFLGIVSFSFADPFSVFEHRYPHLVAVDSAGFARNKISFSEREHEEMRAFTQASEIGENVWVSSAKRKIERKSTGH